MGVPVLPVPLDCIFAADPFGGDGWTGHSCSRDVVCSGFRCCWIECDFLYRDVFSLFTTPLTSLSMFLSLSFMTLSLSRCITFPIYARFISEFKNCTVAMTRNIPPLAYLSQPNARSSCMNYEVPERPETVVE